MPQSLQFLEPLLKLISAGLDYLGWWNNVLALFLLFTLGWRLWALWQKLRSETNWSSKDRTKGLQFAIDNHIPISKIQISVGSLFSLTGILGLLGTYNTFANGQAFEKILEFFSYALWATVGIAGAFLAAWRMRFHWHLKSFHQRWIKEHYENFIDRARSFFVRYIVARIASPHENLLKPFIYLRVRDLKAPRKHLGESFFDTIWIDGVFPGENTSLFFVPPESRFEFDLIRTVKNIYASEFTREEAKEEEGIKKRLKEIEEYKVEGLFDKLSYYTTNLDNTAEEKKLSDINPTGLPWLLGRFRSDTITKEVFYRDVQATFQKDDAIVLRFSHNEPEIIEASKASRELDQQMIRQIENIIRSKKR